MAPTRRWIGLTRIGLLGGRTRLNRHQPGVGPERVDVVANLI